jgi:hypothetical protein
MGSNYPDVELPTMIDDEFLLQVGEGQQPNQPSRMFCFVYSIQLTNILEEVLLTFYHRQDGKLYLNSHPSEALSRVLTLDAKLHQFWKTIPDMYILENHHQHRDTPWHSNVLLQASVLWNRCVCS